MGDMASMMLRSKSAMTRLIDRMEREGLVRRQSSITDRRSVLVALTDEGRNLIERVKPGAVQIMIDRFTSHVSAEEARAMNSVLSRILEANAIEFEHGFPAGNGSGETDPAGAPLERAS